MALYHGDNIVKYSLIMCSNMHMDIETANELLSINKHIDWVADYTIADVIIIMTCAFGTKKKYSMYVIADAIKNAKANAQIIATGCLTKTNENELKAIPNLEVKSFEEVKSMLKSYIPCNIRENTVVCKIPQNTVVISKGCLKKCSYCVYPLIEDKYTSKPIEEVLKEVEKMCKSAPVIYISGAHETSDYGIDIYGYRAFPKLLDQICTNFPNCKYVIGWFHPSGLTNEFINVVKKHKDVIVQIMVHIQHINDKLLRLMNRPSFKTTETRIQKLHKEIPNLKISTEVIVGFPGETEEMFYELVAYLEKNREVFSDVGVASFEPVINTKAAQLEGLLSMSVRNERMEIIKKKFNATAYEAPKDFESLILSYLEACYLLERTE